MITAAPSITAATAPKLATLLSNKLNLDYSTVLAALSGKSRGSTPLFAYVARKVPAAQATERSTRPRHRASRGSTPPTTRSGSTPPAMSRPTSSASLAPTDRWPVSSSPSTPSSQARTQGDVRVASQAPASRWATPPPWSRSTAPTSARPSTASCSTTPSASCVRPTSSGTPATDGDRHRREDRRGPRDRRRPDLRRLRPGASPKPDRGARSLSEVYEPGSVEKILTLSSLIDAGKVTDRTQLVVPGEYKSGDHDIHDWFSTARCTSPSPA